MKNSMYLIALFAFSGIVLSSCQSGQLMTSYENDDLYYSPGDVYITDYYEAQASTETQATEVESQTDDYWDEGNSSTYSADQMTVNNFNAPFGYNPYGGFNSCLPYGYPNFNPGFNMGFSTGWGNFGMPSTYFGFNYNYPFGNGYNYGYSPFNNWNNPYCFNSFGYNSWNNPWNNPWNNYYYPFGGYGGYGNNYFINNYFGDTYGVNTPIYGHRPQLSTNSVYNSTYTGGTLFNPANRLQRDSKTPVVLDDKPATEVVSPRNPQLTPKQPQPEIKPEKSRTNNGLWDFFGTTPDVGKSRDNNSNDSNGGINRTPTPGNNTGRQPSGGNSGGSRTNGGSGSGSGGSGRTPRK